MGMVMILFRHSIRGATGTTSETVTCTAKALINERKEAPDEETKYEQDGNDDQYCDSCWIHIWQLSRIFVHYFWCSSLSLKLWIEVPDDEKDFHLSD